MQYSLMDRPLVHETTRRPSHSVTRTIGGDSRAIAQQEQRESKQAATSLDSLYNVYKQNRAVNSDLQIGIVGWFVQVRNASASDAAAFIAQLQEIGAALGGV